MSGTLTIREEERFKALLESHQRAAQVIPQLTQLQKDGWLQGEIFAKAKTLAYFVSMFSTQNGGTLILIVKTWFFGPDGSKLSGFISALEDTMDPVCDMAITTQHKADLRFEIIRKNLTPGKKYIVRLVYGAKQIEQISLEICFDGNFNPTFSTDAQLSLNDD